MDNTHWNARANLQETQSRPLFMAGCVARLLIVVAVLAVIGGIYAYFYVNTDLFGLGAPDFQHLSFDSRYEQVTAPGKSWAIQYEFPHDSTFQGTVRHVSPIREPMVPFLTHDILVTTGDFADPRKVDTSVSRHHFTWFKRQVDQPQGTINLLHVVPLNAEIYHQLLAVRTGQRVTISGPEILKINVLDGSGQILGSWQDTGCNSILVTSVRLEP